MDPNDMRLKQAAQESAEKIAQSAIFLPLWTRHFANDPLAVMQLGMAILTDKPLYVLLEQGQHLPESIRRIARKVVEYDKDVKDALHHATTQLLDAAAVDLKKS